MCIPWLYPIGNGLKCSLGFCPMPREARPKHMGFDILSHFQRTCAHTTHTVYICWDFPRCLIDVSPIENQNSTHSFGTAFYKRTCTHVYSFSKLSVVSNVRVLYFCLLQMLSSKNNKNSRNLQHPPPLLPPPPWPPPPSLSSPRLPRPKAN